MTRSEGERIRARHILARLRGCLEGVQYAIDDPHPPGYDAAQAVLHTAGELATSVSRLDAYLRAEGDQPPAGNHGST